MKYLQRDPRYANQSIRKIDSVEKLREIWNNYIEFEKSKPIVIQEFDGYKVVVVEKESPLSFQGFSLYFLNNGFDKSDLLKGSIETQIGFYEVLIKIEEEIQADLKKRDNAKEIKALINDQRIIAFDREVVEHLKYLKQLPKAV